jgi:2-(1,2-epoxy-1,2-dihydrophenyl)acetyl-CoA isomerase
MTAGSILVEDTDVVRTITLNRPEKRNAIDTGMMDRITSAIAEAETDGCRAIIIQGAGPGFSSGGDLSDATSSSARDRLMDHALPMIHSLLAVPIPVIASVHGFAYGAGFALALAADVLVAESDARFCQVSVVRGLVPDCGSTVLLHEALGGAAARMLMMTGSEISGRRLAELGAATLAESSHSTASIARARELSEMSAVAYAQTKRLVNRVRLEQLHVALESEAAAQEICRASPEAIASRRRFRK